MTDPVAATTAKSTGAGEKSSDSNVQLSSAKNKDANKPSRPDHGKTPQWLEDKEKAEAAARKDPLSQLPAQYLVEFVEPKGTAAALDGLNPQFDGNEHITGGTLPPV